ncbi:MAG: nucleotidyltransferase family protein [Candidatus Aenigmarchaeota archaeon]|nr:nucleotidyltransferase family protein [Candidatus Aenigmarchaeota archaeon]
MNALVLAGGFAQRMGDLARDVPKALLPLKGKPILEHVLRKIEPLEEVKNIYLSINARFESQFTDFLQHRPSPKFIKLVVEPSLEEGEKLGSVGGIKYFMESEQALDPLLVIAGDNALDTGLFGLLLLYKRVKSPVVGLYDVKSLELAKTYGVVTLDDRKRIVAFEEKPPEPTSTLASTGIYIFTVPALERVEDYLDKNGGDRMGDFIRWLAKQEAVYGFVFGGKWFDIGSPQEYTRAERELD